MVLGGGRETSGDRPAPVTVIAEPEERRRGGGRAGSGSSKQMMVPHFCTSRCKRSLLHSHPPFGVKKTNQNLQLNILVIYFSSIYIL
jgi:hypothetical protein